MPDTCQHMSVADAPPTYYFSLGRMICRAAEAEHMMEALLLDLEPEIEPAEMRGLPAGKTRERVLAKVDLWPGQRDQILDVVEVMETTSMVRNWLVHAWVLASPMGDWVELQKAEKDRRTGAGTGSRSWRSTKWPRASPGSCAQ